MDEIDPTADLCLTATPPGAPAYGVFDNFLAPESASEIAREMDRAKAQGAKPDKVAREGARLNFNRGEQGYDALRSCCPTLDRLMAFLESPVFFERAVSRNAAVLAMKGIARAPEIYDPSLKERGLKTRPGASGALRMGFAVNVAMSYGGYEREPHTDNRHKVLVGLLYFDDIPETAGGGTIFWNLKAPKALDECERFPDVSEVRQETIVQPRRGRLALFANSNDAYHGVAEYKGESPRHFLYFTYFSDCKTDVWRQG